jgi:hypothetical protein
VDQREDGGRSADSQGEGEDGCRGEHRREPELPDGVAETAKEIWHQQRFYWWLQQDASSRPQADARSGILKQFSSLPVTFGKPFST